MRVKLLSVILLVLAIAKATELNEGAEADDGSNTTTTTEAVKTTTILSTITTEADGGSNTTVTTTTEAVKTTTILSTITTEADGGSNTTVTITTEAEQNTTIPSTITTEANDGSNTTVTTTTEAEEVTTIPPTTTTEPAKGSEEYPINVPNKDGKPPCIFSKMNITLRVTYEKTDNTTGTVSLLVPDKPKVDGECGETVSTMSLSWPVATMFETRNIRSLYDVYADENNIIFHFKKNDATFSLVKIDIDISLDPKTFPQSKEKRLQTTTNEDLNLFSASASNSKYVCNEETFVPVKDERLELSMKDVDLIAFNEDTDITSRSEVNCSQTEDETETADVGAIVGGIIGALAIVGIIGFIIWRRRKNSYAHSEVP